MATRAKIHIARREEGVSFSEIPKKVIVSIYNHYDGYFKLTSIVFLILETQSD